MKNRIASALMVWMFLLSGHLAAAARLDLSLHKILKSCEEWKQAPLSSERYPPSWFERNVKEILTQQAHTEFLNLYKNPNEGARKEAERRLNQCLAAYGLYLGMSDELIREAEEHPYHRRFDRIRSLVVTFNGGEVLPSEWDEFTKAVAEEDPANLQLVRIHALLDSLSNPKLRPDDWQNLMVAIENAGVFVVQDLLDAATSDAAKAKKDEMDLRLPIAAQDYRWAQIIAAHLRGVDEMVDVDSLNEHLSPQIQDIVAQNKGEAKFVPLTMVSQWLGPARMLEFSVARFVHQPRRIDRPGAGKHFCSTFMNIVRNQTSGLDGQRP